MISLKRNESGLGLVSRTRFPSVPKCSRKECGKAGRMDTALASKQLDRLIRRNALVTFAEGLIGWPQERGATPRHCSIGCSFGKEEAAAMPGATHH